ncbi:MAG: MFS transporter [Rhodospirillaceae bacterium]|nr:MFS transporter [Rhodospirillaceae bacterium]
MQADTSCARLKPFPLWLASGISPANAWTYMFANFAVIGTLAFLNVAQSYILTEHLQLAKDTQGTVSGNLAFWNEVIIILLASPFGILADRIGRRPIVVFAAIAIAVGFTMYAYATSVFDLTIGRIIYAIGAAAGSGMVATIGADYPQEISRGKMIGLGSVMNAFGIVFLTGLMGRVPTILRDGGMDPIAAGQWMMLITAGFCVFAAVIFQIGLKGGIPASHEKRLPLAHLIRVGLSAARNPRVALSYAAAFTSRGDLVVVGIFISLWSVQAGTAAGLDTGEALKRGTIIFVASQTMALLWAPVMGWLMDKVNRVTAIIIAMGLASGGYLGTAFLTSPLEGPAMPIFIILGIGQVSALMTSQGLVGQETKPQERGAVVGMFSLWGAVGILFATAIGGRLFDSWAPYAPFVVMGIANLGLLIAAIFIRVTSPGLILRPAVAAPVVAPNL